MFEMVKSVRLQFRNGVSRPLGHESAPMLIKTGMRKAAWLRGFSGIQGVFSATADSITAFRFFSPFRAKSS
jgi:hypothetical protein